MTLAPGEPTATTGLITLTNPTTQSQGTRTFTAPASTVLLPDTTYFVVTEGTAGEVSITADPGEDDGGGGGLISGDDGSRAETAPGDRMP